MLVYDNYKLSHSGITKYTTFEGLIRRNNKNSLANLLSHKYSTGEIIENDNSEKLTRNLNQQQSRKLKRYANKLCYYSSSRKFKSNKSGIYTMKVAFLTLTAPENTNDNQFLKAFEGFLDYLRRTANCVYVWKKELGETNGKLHVHLLINNFIPFYIVSWKWKRLLLSQGVEWPLTPAGKQTDSHYRIELPKSKRQVGSYIAKYLSKAYELPKQDGYIWGKSSLLDDCKELIFMEGELNNEELIEIGKHGKIVGDKYVRHVCIDLMSIKEFSPGLFAIFEKQYLLFNSIITLTQKFNSV